MYVRYVGLPYGHVRYQSDGMWQLRRLYRRLTTIPPSGGPIEAMTQRQISVAVARFARRRGDTIDTRNRHAVDDAHASYLQSPEYQEMIADMTVDEHRR